MKRLLSLALCAVLLACVVFPVYANGTEDPNATTEPSKNTTENTTVLVNETETPKAIEAPVGTETPKVIETPVGTETPKETETPVGTETPKETEETTAPTHLDGCTDDCTVEGCACSCHELSLFDRLMACETLDEVFTILDRYTDEEIEAALSEEEIAQVGKKIDGLMPQPLPEIVIDKDGAVVSEDPAVDEPFVSEIVYVTVNFDNVAPFGAPVNG